MPLRLDNRDAAFAAAFDALLDQKREEDRNVDAIAADILENVRKNGDAALLDYTAKFDRLTLDSADKLRLTDDEIQAAIKTCEPDTLDALKIAARRIEDYHRKQFPEDAFYEDADGVSLGYRWTAIENVGLYVPGGRATYPSSVLMNAIPAKVAGASRLVMVVPMPDGAFNPLVLAAADLCGVDEIYRIGGAQAIAALAFGTETIAPVDKIVGPGNAFVASAKKQVFGTVGIDMIAGPSEILVVADNRNDPAWIAADLLSQAEHDPVAQSILITDDAAFARNVEAAIETHLKTLKRAEIARTSWETYGAVIIVQDMADAPHLVDRIAPEHLELCVDDPEALAADIRHAGAIFLGRYSPEAIGDYVAGPNHVLPTSRTARFSSGLSTLDFVKRTSLMKLNAESLRRVGPAALALAESEGLDAHALSVSIRMN
ncbi:MAG: histidinol dehydrogenase [Sneathiella sp.]|jgi:histidinol dehydrogenase|uniref:histidinol dehydrogenase n=1 Tax=Sneathiella sp. TaxID=1964365 RepID=UPI000C653EC6|nr:histidinol dehydrogenase [Sneathiella sp.]MAL80621.1 histidinol dehydrogenase [Sneathiella sp.]